MEIYGSQDSKVMNKYGKKGKKRITITIED